jgi:DNA invertase Pin-like site-specific DNA recombinase
MKRAIVYARVSTADKGQDHELQLHELTAVAQQRGWTVVGHFWDIASGAKDNRPGMIDALNQCRRGGVDIFAAVSVDRVARSVLHLLKFVGELEALGVRLACTREGDMDTTTPQGAAFLQMRGIFAELERKFIAQRIRESLAVKRARGVKLGRKRTIDYGLIERARKLRGRKKPASWSTIARELGGTPGAWSRALSRSAP